MFITQLFSVKKFPFISNLSINCFQRLIPVDTGNDLFIYKLPELPELTLYTIRPYTNSDEARVYRICHETCRDGSDATELFPEHLQGKISY